ncbi:putative UDP-glucuronate 4-epimerase [Helianthus annuus]|uniref:UDP-glucuronate 4-epimerase n=1 Tax=Helianthus annuus TaxID=4232 RepID=A0A9K3ELX5_HELAN|nr:putative UDP-glucuronate 4-epimerase [Helianthus annuus]
MVILLVMLIFLKSVKMQTHSLQLLVMSEKRPNRSTPPASLYAGTKKAGEEISHTYNHIYGLSLTGLRFFMVYGPWGRSLAVNQRQIFKWG